jgi:F420H(2)-dependent quinone reductase
LQANPAATIQVMGRRIPLRAEVAGADRHDALYQQFMEVDKRFVEYPKTAHRTIPVVLLHPAPPT